MRELRERERSGSAYPTINMDRPSQQAMQAIRQSSDNLNASVDHTRLSYADLTQAPMSGNSMARLTSDYDIRKQNEELKQRNEELRGQFDR